MTYIFKHVILGGTFDHFHKGHANFLSAAFSQSENITIGIVAENPKGKILVDQLEAYTTRLASLTNYLTTHNLLTRSNIITLHDIYGTSLTDPTIEAIAVTDTTNPGAQTINLERKRLRLPPLKIILVPQAVGEDGEIISSSRIRSGLIDRDGHSYLKYFLNKSIYYLPDDLRSSLQVPLGTVIKDIHDLPKIISTTSTIISVGDIVSIDLQKAGYTPNISIIDYHTRRHALESQIIQKYFPQEHAKLNNQPGTINSEIARIFYQTLSQATHPQLIGIKGEEDLLALPVILLSPLGSYLIYGQYQVGMCIVKITEELKAQIKLLLSHFD